jgi:D-glycero-D-manno-heptose 1,7-bisphosphate phosphatase
MHHNRAQLLPPIPGTGTPPRGLFVSRWGALLERPADGFPKRFEDVCFNPRVLEILFRAGQAGWNIYTIGNEEAVAHGRVSDGHWGRFHAGFCDHLRANGIPLARDYACLDHPAGKAPHDKESVFWFPNTGALYHAAQEDGIVLSESWVVSDIVPELAAAWRAGAHVAAIHTTAQRGEDLQVEPDIRARRAFEAIAEVLATAPAIGR